MFTVNVFRKIRIFIEILSKKCFFFVMHWRLRQKQKTLWPTYISSLFEEAKFPRNKLVGVCTDRAPAMRGSRSGFVTQVKQSNPEVVETHCMIYREALASKTLPSRLRATLNNVIKVVNYAKGSALKTKLFRQLCTHYESIHHDLLFYTQVRWYSKGNMLD